MKKIDLSKETLRVLTAQETRHVAGGFDTERPRTQCFIHEPTRGPGCDPVSASPCATDACPGPTVGCPPAPTLGCPPATQGCTGTGTGTPTSREAECHVP